MTEFNNAPKSSFLKTKFDVALGTVLFIALIATVHVAAKKQGRAEGQVATHERLALSLGPINREITVVGRSLACDNACTASMNGVRAERAVKGSTITLPLHGEGNMVNELARFISFPHSQLVAARIKLSCRYPNQDKTGWTEWRHYWVGDWYGDDAPRPDIQGVPATWPNDPAENYPVQTGYYCPEQGAS